MADEIIEGMQEFLGRLDKLEHLYERSDVLVRAARAGAELVAINAARRAPRMTGRLADNMVVTVRRESDINEATADTGPDRKQFYGMFQEFGTKTNKKQSFLEPALESNRDLIIEVMRGTMFKALEEFE